MRRNFRLIENFTKTAVPSYFRNDGKFSHSHSGFVDFEMDFNFDDETVDYKGASCF